ncbi:MAG: hypothetical protein P4M01_13845 [Acidobacteriota bacterium]|nr:hypothetical protein [Acidobacteriota bacterium]
MSDNVNITVDTTEMAHAINTLKPRVDATTAAVVAMQTAVIIAEREAANDICHHVNRGFFSLIRSQVTQKMAAARSHVEARLLELRDQSGKLRAVKTMMERDFNMIAARYTKLFRTLDGALFTRIHQVDQPTVDLVHRDYARIRGRYRAGQASLPQHQLESVQSVQAMAAAAARADTERTIAAMCGFIAESSRQSALMARIIGPGNAAAAMQYVPLLLAEMDSASTAGKQTMLRAPNAPGMPLPRELAQRADRVLSAAQSPVRWVAVSPAEKERIRRAFDALVERAKPAARVEAYLHKLYAGSQWAAVREVQS